MIYKNDAFDYGYIRSPRDMCGTVFKFRPHWWVQYLGDGQSRRFDTQEECLEWMKEWDEIGEEQI